MSQRRTCLCCRRRRWLNKHHLCPECAVCLHCEKCPSVNALGLCESCHAHEAIRTLYERREHWTPEWELHLRRKTAEVQRELKRQARLQLPGRLPQPPDR